jgi:hypothetical protein
MILFSGLPSYIASSKVYSSLNELQAALPSERFQGRFGYVDSGDGIESYRSSGLEWEPVGSGGDFPRVLEVASFAGMPSPAIQGDLVTTLDDGFVYERDGAEWVLRSAEVNTWAARPLPSTLPTGAVLKNGSRLRINFVSGKRKTDLVWNHGITSWDFINPNQVWLSNTGEIAGVRLEMPLFSGAYIASGGTGYVPSVTNKTNWFAIDANPVQQSGTGWLAAGYSSTLFPGTAVGIGSNWLYLCTVFNVTTTNAVRGSYVHGSGTANNTVHRLEFSAPSGGARTVSFQARRTTSEFFTVISTGQTIPTNTRVALISEVDLESSIPGVHKLYVDGAVVATTNGANVSAAGGTEFSAQFGAGGNASDPTLYNIYISRATPLSADEMELLQSYMRAVQSL